MNDSGDAIVGGRPGIVIKPSEGVFVFCPNDGQMHHAVLTTTNPETTGDTPSDIAVVLPAHGLSESQDASLGIFTQTVELSQGWNWFSTYIEVTNPVTMLNKLKESLGENALQISSINDGTTEYDDGEWIGDLDEMGIFNGQMYLIYVAEDCTVELQGAPANLAEHEITINPGWNWIGFPCAEEIEVNVALANFEAEIGDMIASQFEGVTEYDDEWIGDLETFVPGQGYLYYSNSEETKILIFQSVRSKK